MFIDNPMYFFAFAVASLILFIVLRKLGVGYMARWITAGVALVMWWAAAGGPIGMWHQAYAFGSSVAHSISALSPSKDSPLETMTGDPSEKADEANQSSEPARGDAS